ncbi:transcription factor HIVEP3 isoform X2 [Orussus abietinus]|nr:transcription factor HIVEP3 isoform X2 [Orussus abietinus]XP_012278814.1 transcription factor HIVEP3 isoform X2 [Orussus abietinus]XP_012278816.1 transcription factor HIVEP3 isoform X2 [Orussus abietinus]
MTDPQLNNNNNNNDGEPKYLHKKFKKMATTEVSSVEPKKETSSESGISETPKRRDKEAKESPKSETSPEPEGEPNESRKSGYICPYCKLSCAKPSVLQKHIRAHTNERPYPCVPCGFAFKTKSNLYKHCRSRAHALKMEGGDASKVSEDSDISLSDSASNGTGTPPPPPASTPTSTAVTKTVKTGKIYKPKFHTALQCVNNEAESSSLSSSSSTSSTSNKPNAEQLQEHIDKIITDNQAIVDAVDPRLHKLMQRQQSLVEPKPCDQPLNLSSADEPLTRKRCYSESFTLEKDQPPTAQSSIIKDLLLKTRSQNSSESSVDADNFVCPSCKIPYSSADNLDAHRRYYCKGAPSPRRPDFQLDLEKKESDFDLKSDYYGSLQPLPSPGPLLGNTRLVDAYAPPTKKQKCESVPTTLRSLEELSKYPRPNSLQMFGGEVRILDNTGETKTMRIEPRQTTSPSEHIVGSKCVTSETASIVVRSGLHSGGTMVHKPQGTPVSTSSSSISLPNTPKMLAPIIPNISTPNIAPTMSCYNYLEPHLNPLTSISAYNPLTLPAAGIASILHGGKVIPYVPGMPGPHTLSGAAAVDIAPSLAGGDSGYKVIPGLPGLHMIPQPLDLASPVKVQTPNIPGMPGPLSNVQMTTLGQPLDLASPAKDLKLSFKTPISGDSPRTGLASPQVPSIKAETPADKFRGRPPSTPTGDLARVELDRHIKTSAVTKYKGAESPRERRDLGFEKSPKVEKAYTYPSTPNNLDSGANASYGKAGKFSPKPSSDSRKRPSSWNVADLESGKVSSGDPPRHSPVARYEPPPHENGRPKVGQETRSKVVENHGTVNGAKLKPDSVPPVITVNQDSSKTDVPNKTSLELAVKLDKSEARSPKISEIAKEETNPKFLRPTSLPLKPGTFTPKKHHGITPTANTLPLISPETPRPRKSYGQLYLNGHAYTYLGLKCSTRVFYCTLNRPQPMYVTQQHGLSMYSNWKICKEAPPDLDVAHYDSRQRPLGYTIAWRKQEDILTHSSQRPTALASSDGGPECDTPEKQKRVKIFDGGFESNEDYTYVRGRGRGRYVCEECGIRCKKPSMLKKHIRTHTDVRPYTCKHCAFSFKTKGNLTKHMKSKAHYKKCVELGVVPVPTTVCEENIDKDAIARLAAGGGNTEDSSSEEDDSDGEESEESGSEEHEAAQSLLSLSQHNSNRMPGLLPLGRPTTYPYTTTFPSSSVATSTVPTVTTSSPLSTLATTVIQSELSHRYYFPSSRSIPDESRSSVIQSSKKDDSDVEVEELGTADNRPSIPQPMDLTTKQPISSPIPQRAKPADILTPVSEPILMQTIVQTMERLPIQGREWKPDAEGHMLQAYLTERYVMDSKIKQQYRVGTSKVEKTTRDREIYSKQPDSGRTRNVELNGTPTVTYTDPSKMRQSPLEPTLRSISKQTSDDIKLEIRDMICQNNVERRPFDIESIHKDKEPTSRVSMDREAFDRRLLSPAGTRSGVEYSSAMCRSSPLERANFLDLPGRSTPGLERYSPKSFAAVSVDFAGRIGSSQLKTEIDRSSMFNAMKMMSEVDAVHPLMADGRPPSHEGRPGTMDARIQNHSPRSQDMRPPSREIRTPNQEYPSARELRPPSGEFKLPGQQELRLPTQDLRSGQDMQPIPGMEARPVSSDARSSREARLLTDFRLQVQEVKHVYEVSPAPVQDVRHVYEPMQPPALEASRSLQDVSRSLQDVARVHADAKNCDRLDAKHSAEMAKQNLTESIKHTVARKMVVGGPGFRPSSPPGGAAKPQAEFLQPSSGPAPNYVSVTDDGRSVCGICNKVFIKPSQLRLHINIHYFERPFRCESCAVSFRTKGHLTKHERSVSHHNKVSMTSTFGAATTSNPRPFKCTDCKVAFRIHGHLAKHLRSKMHIMKLECLGKLPFGTYAEMERSGVNLNDIDTTDCDNSLTSLQILAQKLYEKDPSKMGQWDAEMIPNQASGGETSSDEGEPIPQHSMHQYHPPQLAADLEASRGYHMPLLAGEEAKSMGGDVHLVSPHFVQPRSDHVKDRQNHSMSHHEEVRPMEGSLAYKCRVCTASMRTVNELQVHCFVEHNIESEASIGIRGDRIGLECRDVENTHKRMLEESAIREDHSRQKIDDT